MKPYGLFLALAVGCNHPAPFGSSATGVDGPFGGGAPPVRLTYNIGYDIWPSWSPDGSRIFYSAQDSMRPDKDHCVVAMPAAGGTRTPLQCPAPFQNDLTEIFQQPAFDGQRLAYAVSELGSAPEHAPFRFSMWLAPAAPNATARSILQFPYLAPSGSPHDAPMYLQWLRPGVLLYLGAENGCCNKDTLRFGENVVLFDVTAPKGTPRTYVPGTHRASAVAGSRDGTAIFYTFYGDSAVYRQDLASGQVDTAHNFGSGHIVRDPDVAGGRMIAVLDGQPNLRFVPPFDTVQVDYGGHLVLVDLASGAETILPDNGMLYKRPRFSPAGDRIVVEGYPYQVSSIRDANGAIIGADTVTSKWDDLWLLEE
ncbi:MAG TPA: hypothetical protein VNH46_06710 [Gemmatimonadales bacterium]|nr:hypothetical protein [Gemmatimonadales bacterium]